MRLPLETCVHEAGHALVAVHFRGPCLKDVTVRADGYGHVKWPHHLFQGEPLLLAAVALAGGVAERMLTPWAHDPNPSEQDFDLVDEAYGKWSGGTVRGLERRAFYAHAARIARGVLRVRRGELVFFAEALADTGQVPDEYLAPDSRLAVAAKAPSAPPARGEVKSLRDLHSEGFASRLEENIRRVNRISGPVAPREAWGWHESPT